MYDTSIAIQVLPQNAGDSLIGIVDKVIEYIIGTGLSYTVGPFETTVEGDFDTLMDIIKEAQKICVKAGAPSVISFVKIHYKPDGGVMSIHEKVSKYTK